MSDTEVEADIIEPEILDIFQERVQFVDWIVRASHFEGMVSLTVGAIDGAHSNTKDTKFSNVVVGSKLRMTVPFAERLAELLTLIVSDAKAEARDDTKV